MTDDREASRDGDRRPRRRRRRRPEEGSNDRVGRPAAAEDTSRDGPLPRHELVNPKPIPGRLGSDAEHGLSKILDELKDNPPPPAPEREDRPPRRRRSRSRSRAPEGSNDQAAAPASDPAGDDRSESRPPRRRRRPAAARDDDRSGEGDGPRRPRRRRRSPEADNFGPEPTAAEEPAREPEPPVVALAAPEVVDDEFGAGIFDAPKPDPEPEIVEPEEADDEPEEEFAEDLAPDEPEAEPEEESPPEDDGFGSGIF